MNKFEIGQRVRINEEDEPSVHVGNMAIIERIEFTDEPICVVKVDRTKETLSLPQRYLEPIVTSPSTVLANDLFLPWDMDDPEPRFKMFIDDRWISGRIMENLLYYDHIIIPTVDYSIIVPLVHWLGVGLFKELLVSEALSFIRYTGGLAYAGNGVGLVHFELRPGAKPDNWWMKSTRCPPQEAVTLQLKHRLMGLSDTLIELLSQLVGICTVDTALPQFQQKVAEETYWDILYIELHLLFSIRNRDLTRLIGLDANQMRIFARLNKPATKNDEIDITLRLAMLNLEAYLAEESGARDMVTDRGFGKLLDAKVQRCAGGSIAKDSFTRLVKLEKIPDLVSAIQNEEVGISDVWDYRNSRYASQFRKWFDEIGPSDPDKLLQEYVSLLKSGNVLTSGRYRWMRFVILQIIGTVLTPLISIPLNVIDSFLLDKIRIGFNPRYFIDDYRHNFFNE